MLRRPSLGLAAVALCLAPAAAPAATPDRLLPADADIVVSVNVRQVLDSGIVKEFALGQIKDFLQGQDAQKLLTQIGLDPLKDVDRVVLGGSGTDQSDMKFLAVVRGKFNPDKLNEGAVAQTQKDPDHFSLVKDAGDAKLYKYQPENGNPVYATVVDGTAVVVGSDKKLVAAAAAGKDSGVSKEVAALVGKMDDKASVWVAALVKGKLDNVKLPGGQGGNPAVQKQLAGLETMTLTVRVTDDVNLNVGLGMKDAEAAGEMGKTVAQGLQQVKGLLPLLAGGQPQLKPLIKEAQSLKSGVEDKTVVITAKLSGSAIGAMLNPAE
ncbi:MAG: hypothetical protein K2X82_09930 [Gemmataceae bacterium]|nr:hypothetical protein [Gemmataceae bacterium]